MSWQQSARQKYDNTFKDEVDVIEGFPLLVGFVYRAITISLVSR